MGVGVNYFFIGKLPGIESWQPAGPLRGKGPVGQVIFIKGNEHESRDYLYFLLAIRLGSNPGNQLVPFRGSGRRLFNLIP